METLPTLGNAPPSTRPGAGLVVWSLTVCLLDFPFEGPQPARRFDCKDWRMYLLLFKSPSCGKKQDGVISPPSSQME